jgi:hypothetical protein
MITVCKTYSGYTVNGMPVTLDEIQNAVLYELSVEEETALRNFLIAETNGIKIQSSCVTPK